MIPKIVYQVWFGPGPLAVHAEWSARLGAMNPGWRVVRISEDARLPAGASPSVCRRLSNLMRFELLAETGGLYLDYDVEPLRALDELDVLDGYVNCDEWKGAQYGCVGVEPGNVHAAALRDLFERIWLDKRRVFMVEFKQYVKMHPQAFRVMGRVATRFHGVADAVLGHRMSSAVGGK